MAHLIITPDDDGYNPNNPTFLVYDTESKKLVHTCPKLSALDSAEVAGQGRPTFRPFGIASDGEYLYIASNNKLAKFHNYEFVGLVDMPLYVNTHELVAYGDTIFAANTANDTIGIYDGDTCLFFDVRTFSASQIAPIPSDVGSHDGVHVNSLSLHEDKLYFCLHHLNRRTSQLGRFDINTLEGEIMGEGGYCAHGVQVFNDKLYSLSSGTGEVIEVCLSTGGVALYKVVDSSKTFLRGLDILDGKLVFGGSNTYSDDRTIYMNNCFAAEFDTETKKAKPLMYFNEAYIISDMKVLR